MKSISISDDLHRRLMNAKTSTLESADAVIEKLVMPDDNDLIDTMNRMNNPFTCFNCGAECDSLLDGSSDVAMAVLHFDNGSPGNREEPLEPASFYFECIKCYENKKRRIDSFINFNTDKSTGFIDSDLSEIGSSKSQRDRTKIMKIINSIQNENNGLAQKGDIVLAALDKGLFEKDIENIFKQLIKEGKIFQPKDGMFKLT